MTREVGEARRLHCKVLALWPGLGHRTHHSACGRLRVPPGSRKCRLLREHSQTSPLWSGCSEPGAPLCCRIRPVFSLSGVFLGCQSSRTADSARYGEKRVPSLPRHSGKNQSPHRSLPVLHVPPRVLSSRRGLLAAPSPPTPGTLPLPGL